MDLILLAQRNQSSINRVCASHHRSERSERNPLATPEISEQGVGWAESLQGAKTTDLR